MEKFVIVLGIVFVVAALGAGCSPLSVTENGSSAQCGNAWDGLNQGEKPPTPTASVFELAAHHGGLTHPRYRHTAHPEVLQSPLYGRLAVTAVGGHHLWSTSGTCADPRDRRRQLRGIGGVADLDGVVEDPGFVTDLDGLTQSSLADPAGIDVVQAVRNMMTSNPSRQGFEAVIPARSTSIRAATPDFFRSK
jgi:hypothetical protein